MEVNQHSTAMLACRTVATDVVKKCFDSTKLEKVKAMLLPLEKKSSKIYSPTCNHGYFTRRVLKYLRQRKGSSYGKKTRVYCCHQQIYNNNTSPTDHYSRFATSKHDLYMCCPKHHCGFIVTRYGN